MKKLLVTLTMAGALAFPVGVALAQDDSVEPVETQTTVEPVRERAQDRLHQEDGYPYCDGTADMLRTQERSRTHLADGTGQAVQNGSADHARRGDCDGDCTGDQLRDRIRDPQVQAPSSVTE